jgi:hypothetical protein
MVGAAGAFAHRVFVPDATNEAAFLRVTYHEPERLFVISTWQDDLCTAAVRVPVHEAPQLIALLANGLGAATAPTSPQEHADPPPTRSWAHRLVDRVVRRSPRATVIPMRR